MAGARKTRRLESKAPAAEPSPSADPIPGVTRLPDVLVRCVLSHLSVRCFFRAARACRAMRGHALHPSASPHSVEWCGETGSCGSDWVPDSLLRLRPRELAVGSSRMVINQRQIDAILPHMGGALRRLVVNRAALNSMAGFSVMTQLQSLHVDQKAKVVMGVRALSHLTRLTDLRAPIDLMDVRHVSGSCRDMVVDARRTDIPGRRAAWLRVLQRPLTTMVIPDADAGAVSDISSQCRTLHALHMYQCRDVAPLAALPLLTELRYAPDPWTGADDGLGRLTTLRRLELIGRTYEVEPRVGGLGCLSALANLTDLRLDDYPTTAADVAHLCAARCTALTRLDLNIDDSDGGADRLDIRPLSALSTLVNLGVWSAAALRRADLPHPLPRLERLHVWPTASPAGFDTERSELDRMYPALKHVRPDA